MTATCPMLAARAGGLAGPAEHGLDRTCERLPLQPADCQALAAGRGDPVHATASPPRRRPAALDETVSLEPVQCRIHGPLGEPEDVPATAAQVPDDRVAVRGLRFERCEHERVEVPLRKVRLHHLTIPRLTRYRSLGNPAMIAALSRYVIRGGR